jgi:hypothetical protein
MPTSIEVQNPNRHTSRQIHTPPLALAFYADAF